MTFKRIFLSFFIFALVLVNGATYAKELTPVVFVHGYGVSHRPYRLIPGLRRLFKKHGFKLILAKAPAFKDIETSAVMLADQLHSKLKGKNYFMIGHSRGGLVARRALHLIENPRDCQALLSISTPHKGTAIATWAVDRWVKANESERRSILSMLNLKGEGGLFELTPEHLIETFNPANPPIDGISYYSMGFFVPDPAWKSTKNPFVLLANKLHRSIEDVPNDGAVSLESSEYGIYLGSFPGDHHSQAGPFRFEGSYIYFDTFARALRVFQEHL